AAERAGPEDPGRPPRPPAPSAAAPEGAAALTLFALPLSFQRLLSFLQDTAILFGTSREIGGCAPEPRGSGLVGAARPHAPGVSGATRPRTPRFTFGRPKVNRKTAKTKVLDSFF